MATPPMLPTWRSVITRSGGSSSTSRRTASPERASRISVSSSSSAERTSARTVGSSATMRISGTLGEYLPRETCGHETETVEVVDILRQVRHLHNGAFDPRLQPRQVAPLTVSKQLKLFEVLPHP